MESNQVVFISYAATDQDIANTVCHILEENEITCWIAPRDEITGKPREESIVQAICECSTMVLIFSKASNISQQVQSEVELAFENQKTIIPFKVDDSTQMNATFQYCLSRTHWLVAYPDYREKLKALVEAVKNTRYNHIPMGGNKLVFISYSTENHDIANAVCHRLEENDILCWIAPRDVVLKDNTGGWESSIVNAIRQCSVMVLIFSEESNNSEHVKNELRQAAKYKKIIIPFLVDSTQMNDDFSYYLSGKHWLNAFPDYREKLKALVEAVKSARTTSK